MALGRLLSERCGSRRRCETSHFSRVQNQRSDQPATANAKKLATSVACCSSPQLAQGKHIV
jgi:hypothetical protein